MQQITDFSKLDILRLKEAHERQLQITRIKESSDCLVNYSHFLDKYRQLDKNGNSIELECETTLPLIYNHKFANALKTLTLIHNFQWEFNSLNNESFPADIEKYNIKKGQVFRFANNDFIVNQKWIVKIDIFSQQAIFIYSVEAQYKDFPATNIKYDMDLKQMRSAILGNPIKHEYVHYVDISNGLDDLVIENPRGLVASRIQNVPKEYDFRYDIGFYNSWSSRLINAYNEKFSRYEDCGIILGYETSSGSENNFKITAKVSIPNEAEITEKPEFVEVIIRLDWTLPQILDAINEKRTNKDYKEAEPYTMPNNLCYARQ